jgi:hypothetical protein
VPCGDTGTNTRSYGIHTSILLRALEGWRRDTGISLYSAIAPLIDNEVATNASLKMMEKGYRNFPL